MSVPDEWVDIAFKAYACAESDHSDEAPVPMAAALAVFALIIRADCAARLHQMGYDTDNLDVRNALFAAAAAIRALDTKEAKV